MLHSSEKGLGRHVPAVLAAVLGISLSVAGLVTFTSLTEREMDTRLARDAGTVAAALLDEIEDNVAVVQALDSHLTVSLDIGRDRFERFSLSISERSKAVKALEWVPRVPAEQRETFENRANFEGYLDYRITELDAQGNRIPAGERPVYFPVFHLAPYEGNEGVVGFDLGSELTRRMALIQAGEQDTTLATGRIELLQEKGSHGFAVFSPVYRQYAEIDTVAKRYDALLGYAVGVFRIESLVEAAFAMMPPLPLDLYIYDRAGPSEDRFLYYHPSPHHDGPATPLPESEVRRGLHWSTTLPVAGREWAIVLKPLPNYYEPHQGVRMAVLGIGLLITLLLVVYLNETQRRQRQQMALTSEITRANRLLQHEVAVRMRVEENLREHSRHLSRHLREIDALYALASLSAEKGATWEDVCQRAVTLLAQSSPDPDVGVRLSCQDGAVFESPGFRPGDSVLRRPVMAAETIIGWMELHQKGGDFVVEDGNLLDAACERLGKYMERLHAQEAVLEAKAEAEHAAMSKSRFFASASHDLRQPLQAMHLFLHILRQRLHDPKDKDVAEKLFEAMKTADGLLDSLLQVAKLEAGTVQAECRDFPIGELLTKLGNEFVLQAESKGLRLKALPCSLSVHSDPVLLGRILGNLLSNAIRYTESGGILLGARRRGNMLRIEVWDTGEGIPPDHLKAVFQEFYQIGNPERDRSKGLGLGLAIVERMAKLLDHRIDLRSRPGQGSVFAVEVPLSEVSTPAAKAAASPAPGIQPVRPCTVVVVEDEAAQRDGLDMLLGEWGCEVIVAASGIEAAERLRNRIGPPPALVISDFRLGENEDGSAAIRRVCAAVGRNLPAVILTGDTAPERLDQDQAHAQGHRLLHKPVDPERLREIMIEIVGTEERLRA